MSAGKLEAGSIVWAKCGALHWPAELVDFAKLPEDIRNDFKSGKEPQFVVKFFDEDGSYEFLKNDKNLFAYNCEKKEEFIKKGIVKSRSKSKEGAKGWFAKFPEDVIKCEKLTGGDPKLLDKEPYVEKNDRIDYSQYFGDQTEKQPKSGTAGKRKGNATPTSSPKKQRKASPTRPISHPRFKPGGEQHQVRIMQQPSTPTSMDLLKKEESKAASSPGAYTCHICGNSASRMNVIIMCTKSCIEKAKLKGNTNSPKATPKKTKATPAKETPKRAKATPKAKPASTPAKAKASPATTEKKNEKSPAAATSASGRGRGRPPKAKAVSAEPDSNPTPLTPASTKSTPKEKKPRMTKKKKDEMAKEQKKKLEERKKILGEWDEEEDGEAEAEEKKKIKDLTANNSDGSDIESEQEAYFQEDNIQGNIYDDDEEDEELFEDHKDKDAKVKDDEKEVEKEKNEVETAPEEKEEEESAMETNNEDINKLLEETKVPELPDMELGSNSQKKSVKFSETIAKEFAMTKMALVQPKSNMAGPMEVEDEFMEFEEELTPKAPAVAKTILKRKSGSPPPPPREPSPELEQVEEEQANQVSTSTSVEEISSTIEEAEEEATVTSEEVEASSEPVPEPESVASSEPEAEKEAVATSEEPETTEEAVVEASSAVAAEAMLALQQQETTSVAEAVPATSSAGSETASKKDGDTLYLVMDDSMNPNQLDQQTFYIDPNQLANKDLSNVVLTTEASMPTNGHHQQSQEIVATNGSSGTDNTTTTSSST